MKKQRKTSLSRKRFQFDSQKEYLKRFRIYPIFLYKRLDKWLKSMSLKGWHIVHCGVFIFYFERGLPTAKEYFSYYLIPNEGKYCIMLRHPFFEKKYGLKKAKINMNERKYHKILEIDCKKIDVERDVGYRELISDRDRLQTLYFIKAISFISVVTLLLVFLYLFV